MERNLSSEEYKGFESEVKEVNDEEMSIVHFISTENPDRTNDVVRAEGMDDKSFSKNPVVFYGHATHKFPVAKSLWRKQSVNKMGTKGVLAKTQFAKTDEGRTAYYLWSNGFLNAASIGFMPKDYERIINDQGEWNGGYDIKTWELHEYSIVGVPCQQEALRLALSKGNVPDSRIRVELEKQLQEKEMEAKQKQLEDAISQIANTVNQILIMLSADQQEDAELNKKVDAILAGIQELLDEEESEESQEDESTEQPKNAGTLGEQKAFDLTRLVSEAVAGKVSEITGRS